MTVSYKRLSSSETDSILSHSSEYSAKKCSKAKSKKSTKSTYIKKRKKEKAIQRENYSSVESPFNSCATNEYEHEINFGSNSVLPSAISDMIDSASKNDLHSLASNFTSCEINRNETVSFTIPLSYFQEEKDELISKLKQSLNNTIDSWSYTSSYLQNILIHLQPIYSAIQRSTGNDLKIDPCIHCPVHCIKAFNKNLPSTRGRKRKDLPLFSK